MNLYLMFGLALGCLAILAGCWLGWQLLRQNGRILLRLEELEKRFDEFEFGDTGQDPNGETATDDPANRFSNRSLARSKINRSGLKAGSPAPEFRLPRLDGGELSLAEL